eukprot:2396688-Ditylum_brightwellii.AAC.1
MQHLANPIIDDNTGLELEYQHLIKQDKHREVWTKSFVNELGRLAQGVHNKVKGTDTMFFIPYNQVPQDRRGDVTYGCIVVDYRPQKDEPERMRLTIGGDRIQYPGD